MPSALWQVRSALVTLFDGALTGKRVFDGPRPKGEQPKEFLLVGASSYEDDGAPVCRAIQEPSTLGDGTWFDEQGEIDCTAVAWTGEEDMTKIRAAAKRIVDDCETALAADPLLGGLTVLNNNHCQLSGLDLREARTGNGPFIEAIFTVAYRALITGADPAPVD